MLCSPTREEVMKVTAGLVTVILSVFVFLSSGCSTQERPVNSPTNGNGSIERSTPVPLINLSIESAPGRQSEAACWEDNSPGIYATFRGDGDGIGSVGFILRQNGVVLQDERKLAYHRIYDTSARSIEIFGAFKPGFVHVTLTGADGSQIEIVVAIPENQCQRTQQLT